MGREEFATRFKKLKQESGLSAAKLGTALGLSQQTVSTLENGTRSPSFEVLIAISDYFNVSIDYLCGRTDTP